MRHHLHFALAIMAAAFTGCSIHDMAPELQSGEKTITLKACIADTEPLTRLSLEEGEEGIAVNFTTDDFIYVFDADGNMTEFSVTEVDENGIATFSGAPENEIAEGSPITAVVKNGAITVKGTTLTLNLQNQTGTMANAGAHTLLYASGIYSETGVSLVFEHKTSVLKLTLSLPEAETATSVNAFYLFTVPDRATVTDQGGDQFNYYNFASIDALTGETTLGANGSAWINWTTAAPVTDHKVTLYLSVPAVDLKNAALQCTPNSDAQKRYFWNRRLVSAEDRCR